MANENTPNNNLSESIAAIEKCIDAMLSEQRKTAHSAIDMDDWSKTEEIIAATKKQIVRIENLKSRFEEFKAEAVKLEFISADNAAEQPKSEPKPAEQPKSEPKPAEQPKTESKPVEQTKSAEQPKPAPAPQPKPESKPVEQPKPTPKPAEQPKSAPAPQPKPEPKPVEQPKPTAAAPNPASHDRVMEDFDMGTGEDTRATKLIIDACEKLITKFPFSMRLIYSNPKFLKFFTADQVVADNDMNKPKQLSNGLWVETYIPDEKIETFIRGVTRYCEDSVNM